MTSNYTASMNTLRESVQNRFHEGFLQSEQISPTQGLCQIYRRILVGTDFSVISKLAIEQALKLATQNNAELLIAHCFTVPNCVQFAPHAAYASWEEQCRVEAKRKIGPIIEKARKEELKVHMLILSGLPDEAIMQAAKRLDVDLIVIGTHGRRIVPRLFLGSVAAAVVLRAPCAVLTVRSPRHERPSTSNKVSMGQRLE
jgi:nucleotide-binding universal stress UspA family protein